MQIFLSGLILVIFLLRGKTRERKRTPKGGVGVALCKSLGECDTETLALYQTVISLILKPHSID